MLAYATACEVLAVEKIIEYENKTLHLIATTCGNWDYYADRGMQVYYIAKPGSDAKSGCFTAGRTLRSVLLHNVRIKWRTNKTETMIPSDWIITDYDFFKKERLIQEEK